ncbi:MAG: hypothetical protein AB8B53_02075 [Flavobacteriales bacterium]
MFRKRRKFESFVNLDFKQSKTPLNEVLKYFKLFLILAIVIFSSCKNDNKLTKISGYEIPGLTQSATDRISGIDFSLNNYLLNDQNVGCYVGCCPQIPNSINDYILIPIPDLKGKVDTMSLNEVYFLSRSKEFTTSTKTKISAAVEADSTISNSLWEFDDYSIYVLKRDTFNVWLGIAEKTGDFSTQILIQDHDWGFVHLFFTEYYLRDSNRVFNLMKGIRTYRL